MTPRHETPHARAKRHLHESGYKGGGHVEAGHHADAKEDAGMIRKAMHEHDVQQHGGKKTRLKFKHGGHVHGEAEKHRPDRKARGGDIKGNGVVHVDRRYEAEGIHQSHGPEKRAMGGQGPMAKHRGRVGAVNIGIRAGGADPMAQEMAKRQGLQAGVQLGARAAAARMGGAGGAPGAGAMPPPGAPPVTPPGGGIGAPAMPPRPMGPPGAAMAPRPPGMMSRGGAMRRDCRGRFAGGAV